LLFEIIIIQLSLFTALLIFVIVRAFWLQAIRQPVAEPHRQLMGT